MRGSLTITMGIALVVGAAFAPGHLLEAAPSEARVDPGDTLEDLLESKKETGERGPRVESPLGAFWKVVSWTSGVLAVGLVALFLFRRYLGRGGAVGTTAVEVIGRTALSPRHSVYLIRIARRRLVAVGVCGDRMTTLAELDDAELEGKEVGCAGSLSNADASAEHGSLPRDEPERLQAVDAGTARDAAMPDGSAAANEAGRLRDWLQQAREKVSSATVRGE